VRYQKNDQTYFQVIEIPNSNIVEYKQRMTKEFIESKGAKVDVDKPVMYNGYQAIYFEGPSKTDGETKIMLAFGDETFVTMIVGVCASNDKESKKELIKVLSTFFYDKAFKLNPLELANFKFDATITGFKYATTIGNMFSYTPDGKQVLQTDKIYTGFQLMSIPKVTLEKSEELLEMITSNYSRQGMQVLSVEKRETKINGLQAYEMTLHAKDKEDNPFLVYQAALIGENSGVVFMGSDADNGKYIDKFKETVKSIKL